MIQDKFFERLRDEKITVSVYLVNGIKLVGNIESFDRFILVISNNDNSQMIYKRAISTVVPNRDFED